MQISVLLFFYWSCNIIATPACNQKLDNPKPIASMWHIILIIKYHKKRKHSAAMSTSHYLIRWRMCCWHSWHPVRLDDTGKSTGTVTAGYFIRYMKPFWGNFFFSYCLTELNAYTVSAFMAETQPWIKFQKEFEKWCPHSMTFIYWPDTGPSWRG